MSHVTIPGSQAVHEKAPHIASVMITGPCGVGKKTLVQAICTEVGANMFDLSPANIAVKYPGKAGLNMLLHMVFKVFTMHSSHNVHVWHVHVQCICMYVHTCTCTCIHV